MKARLIANLSGEKFPLTVYAICPGDSIPDGYEEIELVSDPPFRGTSLARRQSGDFCFDPACGHPRAIHVEHRGYCLDKHCRCQRFRE